MTADHTTLPVLAVLFLATLIRSAFGFGEALVAVPLLALFIPVEVAAPVAVLVSVTVAGLVLIQDWRHVHPGSAGRLVLSTMFGIPFGLLMLTWVPEPVVKAVLAAVIIAFSAYRLTGRRRFELDYDRLAWLFGFGAGVLGGAYGMNGWRSASKWVALRRAIRTHPVIVGTAGDRGAEGATPTSWASWSSSTRGTGNFRRSSRRCGSGASAGPAAPRSSARPG